MKLKGVNIDTTPSLTLLLPDRKKYNT